MNTQATFRLTKLALMVSVVGISMSSQAVYNLYTKDGLSLDINGQVDMQATKKDAKHKILKDDGTDWITNGTRPDANPISVPSEKDATDRKTRLGQNHGVSYVEFRASQQLPNDWRATANIGLGYSDARNMYLSNSSLSIDKKSIGAISLGRQYLHTNYVNRTGTDTPLDIFSSSALRLDYYGQKGLHTSAYYSFTGINDVRKDDNSGIKSGYGASLSYRLPVDAGQSVRFGLGYSQNTANPAIVNTTLDNIDYRWVHNSLNQYAAKTQGIAGSIEYQAGKFLVAADVGRKEEKYSKDTRATLDTKTTDYLGAKIAYDINPVFQVSGGYGIKKASTNLKKGAEPLSTTELGYSYVDGDEIHLFDTARAKEGYVQLDYRIRPNVRLYTRYDVEETTYKVAKEDISKLSDKNVRAGFVFTF
ncbi:porin [Moraxella sp. ZY200743]|uniref:porin n=1 Tax=Moraxella sp. ZY200743 TaxID=2911970 RepID=UPI003D7E553F